jgi:hypothetical protein
VFRNSDRTGCGLAQLSNIHPIFNFLSWQPFHADDHYVIFLMKGSDHGLYFLRYRCVLPSVFCLDIFIELKSDLSCFHHHHHRTISINVGCRFFLQKVDKNVFMIFFLS